MRHVEEEDRPPSSLRGRLCEVFFSALVDEMTEQLLRRLGPKATLDDPIFGQTKSGLESLRARLVEWIALLNEHDARYERTTTLVGADRDVTEGLFELRADGHHKMLPVAVLMERKREREVALRIYLAGSTFGLHKGKGPAPTGQRASPPAFANDVLDALASGDAARVASAFEEDGALRDAIGGEHLRPAIIRAIGKRSFSVEGVADDGRTCAVEALADGRLALFIFQRGDSGLVRSLRLYSEL